MSGEITNILSIPLAHLVVEVSNNEDWMDSLVYLVTEAPPEPEPEAEPESAPPPLDPRRKLVPAPPPAPAPPREATLPSPPTNPFADQPQLDIRNIDFEMHIRRRPQDAEIVLGGSTDDRRLSIGLPPNVGYLLFYVPRETMRQIWPGKYVGDVVARDKRFERVTLTLEMTIIDGITR
jgi:hypothetical protein